MVKFDLMQELTDGLRIDRENLDEDLIRHPTLFHRVSELHARAVSDRDSLKVDIEKAQASLYNQFRQEAEEANGNLEKGEKPEKVTDTAINRKVEASKKIRDLRTSYLEANSRAVSLDALKESYKQRGYVFNNLTALYTANYFTRESGGKERSEMKTKIADRNREETGKLRRASRGNDD